MPSPHKASRKQEERVAERFGGRTTPGSGNTWSRKNDVRTPDLSFELKTTGKKQYTLKAADLEAGEKQAILDGREFAFGIELNGRNWIVLDESYLLVLLGYEGEIKRMRRCSLCENLLPATREYFYGERNSAGLAARCKACVAQVTRDRTIDNVRMIRRIKEQTPCADCGIHYPHFVMDFDHVRGEKTANISDLVNSGANSARIHDEIAKCEVVCSNCHRKRTWDRLDVRYDLEDEQADGP